MATAEERAARRIDAFLDEVMRADGSDLHFMAGDPARIRVHGELRSLPGDELNQAQVSDALYEIMSPAIRRE